MVSFFRFLIAIFLIQSTLFGNSSGQITIFSNNKEIENFYFNLNEERQLEVQELIYSLIPVMNEYAERMEKVLDQHPLLFKLAQFIENKRPSVEITLSTNILFLEEQSLEEEIAAALKKACEEMNMYEFLMSLDLEEQEQFNGLMYEVVTICFEASEIIASKAFEFPTLLQETMQFLRANPLEITFSMKWDEQPSDFSAEISEENF